MQRALERARKADRSAARQIKQKLERKRKGEAWERAMARRSLVRENSANIKQAKINRRTNWECGPLAPRRDVGDQAETYGTVPIFSLRPPEKHPHNHLKWWHIAEGDRVVLTRGRDRGKISTVENLNKETNTVQLKDTSMIDVFIPKWLRQENNTEVSVVSRPRDIPIEDIKLVYPLPDPVTGVLRDVIIDRLEQLNMKVDGKHARAIPGANTIIPWPAEIEEVAEDKKGDTLRTDVDEKTFRPFLLYPPMPMSVIDELRNKHSKFRTRFDYDKIDALEMSDARVERRKNLSKTMQTPLQELAELRRKQREMTKKELSDEQLAVIGEVMVRERQTPRTRIPLTTA